VISNPDLKAMRLRAGVADAQAFAAGLLPDPTFSFGVDQVLSGPEVSLGLASSLGLDIAALRRRGAVRAQAGARRVRLDLAWAEWQTAGQARIQAARIGALERAEAWRAAGRDATQTILDRMLRAAGRGDILPDQVQGARVAAFDAADRLRSAERDLAAARLELTRLIGLPPGLELRLAPVPLAPPRLVRPRCSPWRSASAPTCRRCGPAMGRRRRRCARLCSIDSRPSIYPSTAPATRPATSPSARHWLSLVPLWARNISISATKGPI
jgi:outer membrane protein TolC